MKLLQNEQFTSREFELTQERVYCKYLGLFKSERIEISYDEFYYNQITRRAHIYNHSIWIGVIAMLIVLVILGKMIDDSSLLMLTFLGCMLAGWGIYNRLKKNELLYLTTKGELIINEEIPSKEAVEEFMQKLNANIKDFYFKKYDAFDKNLPIDTQLNNLMMLKIKEIISPEEYEKMKSNILGHNS